MAEIMAYAASPPDSYYNVSRSPISAVTERTGFLREEFKQQNERRLKAVADSARTEVQSMLDQDELARIDAAIEDAIGVLNSIVFSDLPWVGISDDCIVSLQWRRDDAGVLLTFAGDGVFGFAVKAGPQALYSSGFAEAHVSEGLPKNIGAEISRLSSLVEVSQNAA